MWNSKKTRRFLFNTSLIVAAIMILSVVVFFIPYHHASGKGVVITVSRGSPATQVYDQLGNQGVISSRLLFKIMARIFSIDRKIRAGKYLFVGNYSDYNVLRLLSTGKSNLLVQVTIPEGLTIRQIASIMDREVGVDSTEFVNLAMRDSLAHALGLPSKNLEGFVFPETYEFYYGTDPGEILERMVDEFKLFFNDSLKDRLQKLHVSLLEAVTIASIVEAEAKVDSERAIIASVYYNRLQKGMPLEADPTIEYALGQHRRIYYKDLHIRSPYNTYKKIGLPPTPICNPGRKSIIAALYPAKTGYFYFVATGSGGHRFSRTFAQHLRAVRAYRKAVFGR
ncbi:MAG: endolytic transglycosylase MltG [Candidatus Kryptoniota bacterium]